MCKSGKIRNVIVQVIFMILFVIWGCSKDSTSPEIEGWSSEKLNEAAEFADQIGFSAIMLAQNGKNVFSWGNVVKNYRVHSIRKPFLSALYGIHNTIDLNLTIKDLGIDDKPPELTEAEKQATIKHLLQGRSGIYHEACGETQEMKDKRPQRGSHPPGTFFYYNNWDFNALGTIFEQLTGKNIFEEFKERIADPIGMQDFGVSNCLKEFDPVSVHPKYAFRMSTRDMLKFGTLYLNGGLWNGNQIIPENWISESLTPYSEIETGTGFGYMWAIVGEDSSLAEIFGGSGFCFFGAESHGLIIIPEFDMVLVIRMDTEGNYTKPAAADFLELISMITGARTE